jgi:hypothetical protein
VRIVNNYQEVFDLVGRALGVLPHEAQRQQRFSVSDKQIYRILLDNGQTVALRTSPRPRTFAYTASNLSILRLLNLPVQNVLAEGALRSGGSYIILNWIPGRDLADELGAMTPAQMTAVARQVVHCQRRLGALPQAPRCGWAPIGGSGTLANWSAAFGVPCTAPLDDGTLLPSLRARLCRVRIGLEPYLTAVTPVCFLDDLTSKNVLVENGVLRGIIDVDYVCYGDPLLTVGGTLAGIVSTMAQPAEFYVDELVRFWNPDPMQLRAIHFYAALWLIGSLAQPDASIDLARAQRLASAADASLHRAESSGVAPIRQRMAG